MTPTVGTLVSAGEVPGRARKPEVSLFRLYAMRAAYLLMSGGIATFFWPVVLHHSNELAAAKGLQISMLAGLGVVAALGLRYPVQMLPVLLFEVTWKAIYLIAFALPLWSAHQISAAVAEDIQAVLMVVLIIPLIPWGHVLARYVLQPGERWR